MPLDAQTRALLDQVAAAGGPPMYEMPVPEARAALKSITLAVDAPGTKVRELADRTIPGRGGDIPVRIYWPVVADSATEPLSLLLLIHGGGFALGDLDTHDNVARYYCHHAETIVISVDYRLAPENKFPAAVEDCYDALCWAHRNAPDLGADAGRIAVTGDSAGGNLGAVVCQLARERQGPRIAYQALVYPVVTMDLDAVYASRTEMGTGEYFLGMQDMKWFNNLYLNSPDDVSNPLASPILAGNLAGLPPALIVTASHDPLCDEGADYARRLRAAGVDVEYRCFDGTIHGFMSFSGVLDAGKKGLELVAGCIRSALKNST